MEYLYAPWRGTYARNVQKPHNPSGKSPLRLQIESNEDDKNFILKRLSHTTIFLNIYPYNPGHLLVVPNREVALLQDLTEEENQELWAAVRASVTLITPLLKNSGTNIGVNLGDCASGGSIQTHLHVHIVPRWHGDTGFFPVLADVKPLSEDLCEVFKLLKEPFKKLALFQG